MTQEELAKVLNVNRNTVHHYECGYTPVTTTYLYALIYLTQDDNINAAMSGTLTDDMLESFKHMRTCGHCGVSTRKEKLKNIRDTKAFDRGF